jgi:hypothetical protein
MEATGGRKRGRRRGGTAMTTALSGDSIWYWETSATLMQRVAVGRTNRRGNGPACAPAAERAPLQRPSKKSPIKCAHFLPTGMRLVDDPGDGFVKICGGDLIARQSPLLNGNDANDRLSSSNASTSGILIACTNKMDSEMLCTSNLPHQHNNNPTMITCWCSKRDRACLKHIGGEVATKIGEGTWQDHLIPWQWQHG